MYPILHELLSDRKGGEVFACFGVYHWCYILLAVLAVLLAVILLTVRGVKRLVKRMKNKKNVK